MCWPTPPNQPAPCRQPFLIPACHTSQNSDPPGTEEEIAYKKGLRREQINYHKLADKYLELNDILQGFEKGGAVVVDYKVGERGLTTNWIGALLPPAPTPLPS